MGIRGPQNRGLQVAIVLSGLGHVLHNVQEFGLGRAFLTNSALPLLVTVLLLGGTARPTRWFLRFALLWPAIVVVGSGVTVLPVPLLPFVPAQTVAHYGAHIGYAVLQIPLLVLAWRSRRESLQQAP